MYGKNEVLLLTLLNVCCRTRGKSDFGRNSQYFNDEEVMDCLFKLCDVFLIDDKEKALEVFKNFQEVYNKLSEGKKEYIREEIRNIFPEQNKINKEKEKRL